MPYQDKAAGRGVHRKLSSAACVLSAIVVLGAPAAFAQTPTPDPAAGQSSTSSTSSGQEGATPDAVADLVKLYADQKKVSDAQKAALESEKGVIDAATALKTAKDGTVKGQTTIPGGASGDPPEAEALLLTSRAARSAAKIARGDLEAVFRQPAYGERPVLVITSTDQLTSATLTAFEVRRGMLNHQLDGAQARFDRIYREAELRKLLASKVKAQGGRSGAGEKGRSFWAAAAVFDKGLDIGSKLVSYFKTDYTFGKITVETVPEIYANAIVRSFRDSDIHPRFYTTTHLSSGEIQGLVADLQALEDSYARAAELKAKAAAYATALRARAADDKANAGTLNALALQYDAFAATTGKVLDTTEAFVTALFAGAAEQPAPIQRIARERELQRLVKQNALVLLVTGKPVAEYYTAKSLWNSVFGPPRYVMGGANVAYSLYEASSGYVVTQGVVPVHGGYRNVRDVERLFPAP